MQKYDYDAIIIGSGVGGIACGSILARNGLKVKIFENHDTIGGCCSTFEDQGYKFDTGASIVEFVDSFQAIFERLGRKLEDYIEFIPIDPLYSLQTPDGEFVEIPKDINKMHDVLVQWSKKDARNWLKFCDYYREMAEKSMSKFLHTDMQSFKSLGKLMDLSMLKFTPLFLSTYEAMTNKWFTHQKTRDLMGFQSYWVGSPPRLCAGMYSAINYTEHEGIHYPRGGMIKIPEGILNVGKEYGLELQLKTRVDKIIIKNGKASGIELQDGTKLSSRLVVSNVNAKKLYSEMIGEEHLTRRVKKGIKSYRLSVPIAMLYLGVKGDTPLKAHHSLPIQPYQDMNDIWDREIKVGKFPEKPIGLLSWSSHTDSGMAPAGHHSVMYGAGGPYRLEHGDWDSRKEEITGKLLDHLERTIWPGLRGQLKYCNLSTPVDFERRVLCPEGSPFALTTDVPSTMVFRPSNRSKSIKGLYLVGASTHPGGGVPMVTGSGGITADLILEDWPKLQ